MERRISRRDLLALTGAAVVLPGSSGAGEAGRTLLRAAPTQAQLAPTGFNPTPVWSFDARVPGPDLRVAQGGRIRLRVQNDLPVDMAVHWHGIRLNTAGLTQPAIAPGGGFDYDVLAPDAGTYWYHGFGASAEPLARGLSGALIVDEPLPPDVDHDVVLFLDDWRLDADTGALAPFDGGAGASSGRRLGNLVTVNGQVNWTARADRGSRWRLRLINAATARVFLLRLKGAVGWIMAVDGMPLPRIRDLEGPLTLAPAQRLDLIVEMRPGPDNKVDLITTEPQRSYAVARFAVEGPRPLAQYPPPFPLPRNPVPRPDGYIAAPLTTLVLEGGAMRWLGPAIHKTPGPAQAGLFWSFSGAQDLPEAPVIDARRGAVHRLAVVNQTRFAHVIHLHGHHVWLIGPDGSLGLLRDTVLVQAGETRQVAFVVDNPGRWLMRCHGLGAAAAEMVSWVRVT